MVKTCKQITTHLSTLEFLSMLKVGACCCTTSISYCLVELQPLVSSESGCSAAALFVALKNEQPTSVVQRTESAFVMNMTTIMWLHDNLYLMHSIALYHKMSSGLWYLNEDMFIIS